MTSNIGSRKHQLYVSSFLNDIHMLVSLWCDLIWQSYIFNVTFVFLETFFYLYYMNQRILSVHSYQMFRDMYIVQLHCIVYKCSIFRIFELLIFMIFGWLMHVNIAVPIVLSYQYLPHYWFKIEFIKSLTNEWKWKVNASFWSQSQSYKKRLLVQCTYNSELLDLQNNQ